MSENVMSACGCDDYNRELGGGHEDGYECGYVCGYGCATIHLGECEVAMKMSGSGELWRLNENGDPIDGPIGIVDVVVSHEHDRAPRIVSVSMIGGSPCLFSNGIPTTWYENWLRAWRSRR